MNKKRSTVWRHFKETPGNKVSCRLCNKHFTNHGNTSFMLRHLRRKHPHLIDDVMEIETVATAETVWDDDAQPSKAEDMETCPDDLQDSRKRSAVWHHFQESENQKVSCGICSEKLARQGNTSSMLRHLRRKHPHLHIPLLPTDNTLKRKALHIRSSYTESRFLSVCEQLLKDNVLTDCTLVVDGQCLEAHRLVLASCSESFEAIFKTVTQPNPVIVLRDMTMPELKGLISFMYKGEALVKANEVTGLLKAASHLKVKGLTQLGLPDSWMDGGSGQTSTSGTTRIPTKDEFAYYQDEQNYVDIEEAMGQSHTGYTKRHATLDLMSMCEEVDLGSGTPSAKASTGEGEERLLKRVQIKVERGVDIEDSDQQASGNLQQDEPHTATHYISAGEEVVIHHDAQDMQHSHQHDGTIQATVTMSQGDPLGEAMTATQTSSELGPRTITTSMAAATPGIDDGNTQQQTTATHTIDEEGLIFLGLGGETHTTIVSAGPSTPIKATTKTVRSAGPYKTRKFTRQDVTTAVKLVQEGSVGEKPTAKAFSIPTITLIRASKQRGFPSSQEGKE